MPRRSAPPLAAASAAPTSAITARVVDRISAIPREAWQALAGPDASPFLDWDFLNALEESGSSVPAKGWAGCHFSLWRGASLLAVAPGWLKSHSMGEFMYNDFRWAGAATQFGVDYYPKLILASPFSPATSTRFLVAPGEDRAQCIALVAEAARTFARQQKISSVHLLFGRDDELAVLDDLGFHRGGGVQFHWENKGYATFDDFLARFNAKRRHMIKSERAQPAKDGTIIRTLRGDALTPEVMAFASACYESTVDKHAWNAPHLTPRFYAMAGERLGHLCEVVVAEEGGKRLAAAFNLRGPKRLFGRQWGAVDDWRFLHFNVCYYHSIERAIAEGLEAFEPGAGGEHKLARGFEPTLVESAHWFVDERLDAAMGAYLARETAALRAHVAEGRAAGTAFRAGTSAGSSPT